MRCRRSALFFAVSTLPVLAIAFAFACGTDVIGVASSDEDARVSSPNPNPTGSTANDGSTTTPPIPDSNVIDGPITTDAPGFQAVTIIVTSPNGLPRADVRVVFHDATGAVLETKVTAVDGKATSAPGVVPVMASALLPSSSVTANESNIVTWTGVESGDQLELRDVAPDTDVGTFKVKPPGKFTDAGATQYEAFTGACTSGVKNTANATIPLVRSCVSGTQASTLVKALDDTTAVVGHSFVKGSPVPTDGGEIDIATNAWQLPDAFTVSVLNPIDVPSYGVELLELSDGIGVISKTGLAMDSTASFKPAKGFADAFQTSVIFPSGTGSRQMLAKRAAPSATASFNANDMLPAITASSLNKTNARRPILSWISASSTAGADGGLALINFRGPGITTVHWTFVVPPGSTSVTAPAMPPEADMFLPAVDAGPQTFFGVPEMAFIEADTIASYAVFRQQHAVSALVGLRASYQSFALPPLAANASYKVSSFFESL